MCNLTISEKETYDPVEIEAICKREHFTVLLREWSHVWVNDLAKANNVQVGKQARQIDEDIHTVAICVAESLEGYLNSR